MRFTSAPAVRNLLAVARDAGVDEALIDAFNDGRVVAACMGPVCTEQRPSSRSATADRAASALLVRTVTEALQSRRLSIHMAGRMSSFRDER